jgi:outer membrane autotransporter protein
LSATHAFSARLRGSAGATYIDRTSTYESVNTEFAEQTFDLNLGFNYTFSKRVSFNGSYVFTTSMSDTEANDYYRNRIFLGVQFSF